MVPTSTFTLGLKDSGMRHKRAEKIFRAGARAVRGVIAKGKSTSAQVSKIRLARLSLMRIMSALAVEGNKYKYFTLVEAALRDLHPRTEYCVGMMIRDIADVSVTLNRLEQDRRRTDRQKLIDAGYLCEFLSDEFKNFEPRADKSTE